jgi:hypothetical protein
MGYPDWQTEGTLATLISGALETAGIPVLGNPIPLYSIQATQGTGTPALVGATVAGQAWDPNISHAQAITNFNTYVNGNPAAVASKSFLLEGQWPNVVPPTDQALINVGATIYLSVKPLRAMTTAEQANLAATLAMYILAGAKLRVILWHEPQNTFTDPSQWLAYWAYYQPVIKAAGLACVYDAASWQGEQAVATFWPTPTPDEGLQDLYWNRWQNGVTLGTLIALCTQYGIPVGVGEWNIDNMSVKTPTAQQWSGFYNYVIGALTDQMIAGLPLGAVMFYMATDAAAQPNNLLLSSSDWKAAGFNAMQAALSASPSSPGAVIAPGATLTLPPLAPSQVAGYALANGQSYDIAAILTTSAGSSNPFASLALNWLNDDVRHAPLFHSQRWQLPAAQAGSAGALIYGRGPQLAKYLQLQMTNRDTVNITAQVEVNSVSRPANNHDLRWEAANSPNIPGYTLMGGQSYGLCLGEIDGINLNPGATKTFLCSMYAGQAELRIVIQGAAGVKTVHVSMAAQPPSRWGVTNEFSEYLPMSADIGDNDVSFTLDLVRGPYALTVFNGDADAVTVGAFLTALEH